MLLKNFKVNNHGLYALDLGLISKKRRKKLEMEVHRGGHASAILHRCPRRGRSENVQPMKRGENVTPALRE